MKPTEYSDQEAKDILKENWPEATDLWSWGERKGQKGWLRAQPLTTAHGGKRATHPRLVYLGTNVYTQPDGMWIRLVWCLDRRVSRRIG